MTEEALQYLLKIGRIETLQLIKRDYLVAMLEGQMEEAEYIDFEQKVNAEIYKRLGK